MWTFDVLPEQIPDVRIFVTKNPTSALTLATKDDWIIGWVDYKRIQPIFNQERLIICKNIRTGDTVAFHEGHPLIRKLGIYGSLHPSTPHVLDFYLPRFPPNRSRI